VVDGNVLVSGPCGAAVVGADSGQVRYDGGTPDEVVGVTDDRLFARDSSRGDAEIVDIDLDTGDTTGSYSTNQPMRDATVADGSLVTLDGDELAATGSAAGDRWETQTSVYRNPHLVPDGHLVLVTGGDGSTYAVDAADGHLVWRTVPPVPATSYARS
jgi:outer membrane protein assembly factor BamB